MHLQLPQRSIDFPRRPLIMGIVNVNDDSFSGDGTLDIDAALQQAIRQVSAGADIIDIGAESARTNRQAISVQQEVSRFGGFIERWEEVLDQAQPRDSQQVWPPILSLNTWRSEVIKQILSLGGEILNDMSALPTLDNAVLAKQYGVALLVMHSVGEPKVAHTQQAWENVLTSLHDFFKNKWQALAELGLEPAQLILDPGIDFAKQCADNLKIYASVEQLQRYGSAVLLPVSRKTVIGDVLGIADPTQRDAGTVACIVAGMDGGANLFRVHHVDAAWQAIQMVHTVLSAGLKK